MCCPLNPDDVVTRFGDNSELLPKPGVCGGGSTPRIVNGQKTRIYEYPWMALLEFEKRMCLDSFY